MGTKLLREISRMADSVRISVVIPVGPAEQNLGPIVPMLIHSPWISEVIVVLSSSSPITSELEHFRSSERLSVIKKDLPSRASAMNAGAEASQSEFLLFLHFDSLLSDAALHALQKSLRSDPEALHYFRLGFREGPAALAVNAYFANLRSSLCGMPFGDQGFCLSRENFKLLGGYDETASYGEDHLLTWQARREGVRLRAIRARIETSGRKYQGRYFQVTWLHFRLTWAQAFQELWKNAPKH